MIQTIILISIASLGFRCITDKGMIFYFLRQPFDSPDCPSWLKYAMKPFILCSTCMASVHTLVWWPILEGKYSIETVLVMLAVAFLNTLLYSIIKKNS